MLAPRTIIGFIIGSVIIGIGVYSLVTGLGFQTINVDETFEIGEATSYQISANKGAQQQMKITGEKFDLELTSPGSDPEIHCSAQGPAPPTGQTPDHPERMRRPCRFHPA